MGFEKLGPTQGHATVVTCRPPGRGVTILLVSEPGFLNHFAIFLSSPVDVGDSFVNYLTPT